MIYIIISNVGMALMMIFVYYRYTRCRIENAAEVKNMQQKIEKISQELKESEHKLLIETKTDGDKIQKLLTEIDELRKEKENEVKLRLNAEKQIELTIQKTHDLERMIDDWQIMQDAVISDCKDAMFKIGNDLYKKLNETYKQETETNKNLVGKLSKNITEIFDKLNPVESAPKQAPKHVDAAHSQHQSHLDDHTKTLISQLVETMKTAGKLSNKDFFLPANFDEQRAKLMLCELAYNNAGTLYLIDFKSCRYIDEYEALKTKNDAAATQNLKQKIERYIAYLSNPKYRDSIIKALSHSHIKIEKIIIVGLVPLAEEAKLLKALGYIDKAKKLGIEILDFNEVNNIVI